MLRISILSVCITAILVGIIFCWYMKWVDSMLPPNKKPIFNPPQSHLQRMTNEEATALLNTLNKNGDK